MWYFHWTNSSGDFHYQTLYNEHRTFKESLGFPRKKFNGNDRVYTKFSMHLIIVT